MIRIELAVEDLANTRFGISPLSETVFSLWAVRTPAVTRCTCRGCVPHAAPPERIRCGGSCFPWSAPVASPATFAAIRAVPYPTS